VKAWAPAVVAFLSTITARPALAADAPALEADGSASSTVGPRLGATLLAGVMLPRCTGQPESCAHPLGPAPSARATLLFYPTPTWGIGLMGEIASSHWTATYTPFTSVANPPQQTVESDLTPGFVGLATQYTPVPGWRVSPLFQLALGMSFQAETGSNFSCNEPAPAGDVGAGVRARITSSLSAVAIADASGDIRGSCGVSDGPPATPFAGWGYGFHLGLAFDFGLSPAAPAVELSRR
jgi:hypothetical protein